MQLILRVIGQQLAGPLMLFPPGRYVLGRSPECQVRLQDQAVSRRHAVLSVSHDEVSVCDLGSRYGTAVNGWRTAGEQPLRDGDRLSLACSNFLIQFKTDGDSPGPECLTVPSKGQGRAVEIPAPCSGTSLPVPARTVHGVRAKVYIYGSGMWFGGNCFELEFALDRLLQGDGCVTVDEDQGSGWGIDLVLYAGADVEGWVIRLVAFLQDWQVPDGTVLSVIAYPACGGVKHQRIEIPSRTNRCT